MKREPPLPQILWDQIPPAVQAALWVGIDGYAQHIAALEAQVAALQQEVQELRAQLGQNSQNSSRPPSSDGPQVKRKPPQPPSGRSRGGQPGQPPHQRAVLAVEQGDGVIECKPQVWRRCGRELQGTDSQPWRHQVVEVPAPRAHVTEYQLHRLVCGQGGITPCGSLPADVPPTSYGPRLASVIALCGGAYRMSTRRIASFCAAVLGGPLAAGAICQVEQPVAQALAPPVQAAQAYVQTQDANVDETSWRLQQRRGWLWRVVTRWVRVFCLRAPRSAKVLQEVVGES